MDSIMPQAFRYPATIRWLLLLALLASCQGRKQKSIETDDSDTKPKVGGIGASGGSGSSTSSSGQTSTPSNGASTMGAPDVSGNGKGSATSPSISSEANGAGGAGAPDTATEASGLNGGRQSPPASGGAGSTSGAVTTPSKKPTGSSPPASTSTTSTTSTTGQPAATQAIGTPAMSAGASSISAPAAVGTWSGTFDRIPADSQWTFAGAVTTAPAVVPKGSGADTTDSEQPAVAATGDAATMDFQAPGNAKFSLGNYGSTLQTNKTALYAAADAAGASPDERTLLIAVAMQETTHMLISQRDANKDNTPSANASIFNMNYDMLTMLGYTQKDYGMSLNEAARLTDAARYMLKGFRKWGVRRTLDFHRGGRTAFDDGHSYGAADYRNAMSTIFKQLKADPALEKDARRVEVQVGGV